MFFPPELNHVWGFPHFFILLLQKRNFVPILYIQTISHSIKQVKTAKFFRKKHGKRHLFGAFFVDFCCVFN